MKIVEETRKFVALDDNSKIMGELAISPAGEKIWIIEHTQVNDEFRGQQVGKYLVEYVVEKAREKEVKIIPLCPFANHEMRKNEKKYSDIIY